VIAIKNCATGFTSSLQRRVSGFKKATTAPHFDGPVDKPVIAFII
jgi:hypothetical protein